MKSTNVLMVIAVLAVGLAMFNLIITVNKVQDVEKLTGFAVTDTADVNLSVASNLLINFTTDSVDWGTGYVTPGAGNADLYTNGTIVGGSWSAVSSPLVIENAGNENANISLKASNDAAGFIGSASALYQVNVTEKDAGACSGGMVHSNTWNSINTTEFLYCGNLTTASGVDELYVNVHIRIPETGVPIGSKGSIITATAEVV
ncbi:hypothetical protein HOD88_03630 [archaeon]|jgi:hypothetical protein|nr:hypothetical protein [archaeon]